MTYEKLKPNQSNVNHSADISKLGNTGECEKTHTLTFDKTKTDTINIDKTHIRWFFNESLSKIVVPFIGLVFFIVASMVSLGQAHAASLGDLFGGSNVGSSQKDFLKVDQAFSVDPSQEGNQLKIQLNITPAHYLYKDKLSLQLPKGVKASAFKFSQSAQSIDDPVFGKVAVFKQPEVIATVTLTNTLSTPINNEIKIKWQGCAEAGLCYPPQTETLSISLPAVPTANPVKPNPIKPNKVTAPTASPTSTQSKTLETSNTVTANNTLKTGQRDTANQQSLVKSENKNNITNSKTSNSTTTAQAIEENRTDANSVGDPIGNSVGDNERSLSADNSHSETEAGSLGLAGEEAYSNANGNVTITNEENSQVFNDSANNTTGSSLDLGDAIVQDPFGLAKHPWIALGLLFLAGLGLAFTPCVLPMLPIVSNIVARQHTPTAKKGLLLSGSYALGVAVAYGVLGAIIAQFGQSLGINGWLQNPVILISFAAIFVLLAFYMMDLIRVPVPNAIKQRAYLLSQSGDKYLGTTIGSFIAGFLSALVVSPCVSAPLAGALAAVATVGNPLLGFAALFMLGFGLSVPLMLLGVSQGKFMPKAGEWMNWVKQGFALLLLAVSILLIERVLMSPIILILWAIWFMVVATWAWYWQGRGQLLTKPLAIILATWSVISLVGAATGSDDAWQPLRGLSEKTQSIRYGTGEKTTSYLNSNLDQDSRINLSNGLSNGLEGELSNQPNRKANFGVNNNRPVTSSEGENYINASPNGHRPDIHTSTLDELIPVIEQNKKVLVDVTADWCIECRIMDKTLFTDRPAALQDWQVVRLDVTKSNEESARILTELHLFGPPALLYFVDGKLQVHQVGTIERSEFEATLSKFIL